MRNLQGKVAVVTGAGSGIGRALAQALGAEGCKLALVDFNEATLAETADLLRAQGVACSVHQADVGDRERMSELPGEVETAHGAVHLLFNNAGITLNKCFAKHSLADIDRILRVNQMGVLYGCYFFLPLLLRQPEAHIVNTSSMAGFLGLPNQSTYCMTKAAVLAFSESLRAEVGGDNIGVTSVHPGAIRTNILNAAMAVDGRDEQTQKMADLVNRMGLSPDKLARKVIKAVKANRQRVLIGIDAHILVLLKRLFPVLLHRLFRRAFDKLERQQ